MPKQLSPYRICLQLFFSLDQAIGHSSKSTQYSGSKVSHLHIIRFRFRLHLFQPHQADQMFDPHKDGFILRKQAVTNLATPIKSSCHMNACIVCGPSNK